MSEAIGPMHAAFSRRDGVAHVEDVSLEMLASEFGTPLYVYSRAALESSWRVYDTAFGARPHRVCYSVKSNSNLAVLGVLQQAGAAFDIVSGGELERVLRAGASGADIMFAGVGKTPAEIEAALRAGVGCINVESVGELEAIAAVAEACAIRAPVGLRVNPDVDAQTHPYISTGLRENKFGVDIAAAEALLVEAARSPWLQVTGLDCHIGSQLTDPAPLVDAAVRLIGLYDRLKAAGVSIHHLNFGGGFGIRYKDETPIDPVRAVQALVEVVGEREVEIVIEPGRSISANAGMLLTRVVYTKQNEARRFAITDAAMNDLVRPPLYGAFHEIVHVCDSAVVAASALNCDVVGPICESSDFLGKDRSIPAAPGDLLAVCSAGAYSFVMSSNYNTRPRAAEVLVDGASVHLARRRETVDDLLALEAIWTPSPH